MQRRRLGNRDAQLPKFLSGWNRPATLSGLTMLTTDAAVESEFHTSSTYPSLGRTTHDGLKRTPCIMRLVTLCLPQKHVHAELLTQLRGIAYGGHRVVRSTRRSILWSLLSKLLLELKFPETGPPGGPDLRYPDTDRFRVADVSRPPTAPSDRLTVLGRGLCRDHDLCPSGPSEAPQPPQPSSPPPPQGG